MPFVTGAVVLDAPASALNNAGAAPGAKTDNVIVVKKIRTPGGDHAYVSAQAVRYWIRATLESAGKWKASPVHREGKIAYTDADPIKCWDDDLLGYMRAPSKKSDAARGEGASPLEKDREITRISPFRVSTFVSISPAYIVTDFGTMTRQEGNPVPYEHEFYRAHLLGLLSLDLSAAGTFFDGERVGFKNLDTNRREAAKEAKLEELPVRKQTAFRLKIQDRMERVSTLIGCLGSLNGGAKQTQHYTDLTPAVVFLAVTRNGNNPFYRLLGSSDTKETRFNDAAFEEAVETYRSDFLSPVYVGWAKGFLDGERAKLAKAAAKNPGLELKIGHPAKQVSDFAAELANPRNASWYE